ncbi:hypothetical protein AB1Y20_014292 [Prymnesium parvum]|uniref:Protein kinase domain-containing protein n=1 Tax=Prymnesium parvum TaxID=97485 RepID=A0AB34IGE2_PRYPA
MFNPMLSAARDGDVDKLIDLLENNANIQERDWLGLSPLHWAAENGREAAVRLLLENNADVTAGDNVGLSPLHYAAKKGHDGTVRLLLEKHADVTARSNDGNSPLHWAAVYGHEGVVRLLLEKNADIAAKNNEGRTALDEALRNDHGATLFGLPMAGDHGAVAALLRQAAATASPPQQAPVAHGGIPAGPRDGPPASQPPAPALQTAAAEARRLSEELVTACAAAEEELVRERESRVLKEEEARQARELLVAAELELATERERRVAAGAELAAERERREDAGAELAAERERREAAEEEARRLGEELARTREQLDAVLQAQQRSIAVISIAELDGATDGFSDANKIGQGGFGSVFRTNQPLPFLPHSGPCAVKRLDAGGMQGLREVHSEIRVLSVCWHEHLLPLVGFCLHEATPCLVYPLMAGNLESRVIDPPPGQQRFSWQERVRAIRDATRGLVYLHTPLPAKNSVLHRDVKPSNILLDARGNAKLADVGLAREVPELQAGVTHLTTQRLIGTLGYIDPLYSQSGQFSKYTDGYAMGVSLLVCLGGQSATVVVNRFGSALEGGASAARFTDPSAEWPPDMAEQALEVVRGLIWARISSRRMELSQALGRLEDMADAPGFRPGIRGFVGGSSAMETQLMKLVGVNKA